MNPRLNVLFLIPTLTSGGAERVIVTLLRHLDRKKFRLALAVVDIRGAVFRHEIPDDVEFIDLACSRVRYALPKIVALLWRMHPEVVFSTLGHLNLALAILRPLLPRKSHHIARETAVVGENVRSQKHPEAWSWMYRQFYGKHDAIVCQSAHMQADLVHGFGIPAGKTRIISNPVDVDQILRKAREPLAQSPAEPPDSIRLLAIGRLVQVKGFDLLLRAFAALQDDRFRLSILGEGLLLAELKEQAVQLGVGERVHFAGFQANPYAWLSRADALVMSSRHEAFPNVVLEALACGTPVVALPAPGATEAILRDVPGCVVAKELSALGLTRAIRSWLEGGRDRIPAKAVAPYRVEVIVRAYEALLAGQHDANGASAISNKSPTDLP
jgi:glycosyltransferase involved in cell wall biosynthesis